MVNKSWYRERRKDQRAAATIHVSEIAIPKTALAAIPDDERILLLLCGHAVNQICVVGKLATFAAHTAELSQGGRADVEGGQAMILVRLWIGLVYEAWEMFRRQFQEKRELSSTYLPLLSREGAAAKEELNRHFGKSGEIAGVRNRYAFHAPPGDEMNDALRRCPIPMLGRSTRQGRTAICSSSRPKCCRATRSTEICGAQAG